MREEILPKGWEWCHLGEIVEILDNKRVPVSAKERNKRTGGVPYYGATGQVGWIDKAIFNEKLILLGEDGVKFFDEDKHKCYLISGPAWVNNHAHVLRVKSEYAEPKFLSHYLNVFDYNGYVNGTTRLKLTKSSMTSIPVPLPPLNEQRRIVDSLEVNLSMIDTSEGNLKRAHKRLKSLHKSLLFELIPSELPSPWRMTTVGDAGVVELGRQRHPDWHYGPEMRPYLRVANVFENQIDTSNIMEMDFSGVFEKYRLEYGDVLLNEGQSSQFIGRPAIYLGTPPNAAYTNSLIRFRAHSNVLPEWALLVFRRHMHSGRFMREARITTNIAHLSAKRLKGVEFPIPPIDAQKNIVEEFTEKSSVSDALDRAIGKSVSRLVHLRKALLKKAFSGQLVHQDTAEEPASLLLEHIRAQRTAQDSLAKSKNARPRRNRSTTSFGPPATLGPMPTTAVQQELL